MPLNWEDVRRRYPTGSALESSTTSRTLYIEIVEDHQIIVRTSMWAKPVLREHLELAVELIESGELEPRVAGFAESYGEQVTKERRTLAARVLEDLGYLRPTEHPEEKE